MTHDFETVRRQASHLASSFRKMEKQLDEEADRWRWNRHHNQCRGIESALDTIAVTPNVSVGQEVLAAFDKKLTEAHDDLAAWCDRLLNPDAEQPEEADEIHF